MIVCGFDQDDISSDRGENEMERKVAKRESVNTGDNAQMTIVPQCYQLEILARLSLCGLACDDVVRIVIRVYVSTDTTACTRLTRRSSSGS